MYGCFVCIFICAPCACSASVGSPGIERITDGFELPCGSWELNPGPLQEQPDALNC